VVLLAGLLASPWPAASAASQSHDGGPALLVPQAALARALMCAAPSAGHGVHRPVLLVHGTGLTPAQSWDWNYGAVLPDAGYPTCTVALPQAALGDIQVASEYVVFAVDSMAARWRSPIDVIGHSQGGIEPRWALRWWPGLRPKVDHYIGLASPNHGIVAADVCADSGNCWPAVWQMAQGSRFLRALNSVTEAPGPTSYTNIYSQTDDLVQPALVDPTAALADGSNVASIAVQSVCPGRYVNHGGMLVDAVVNALVLDALGHDGPARAARIPLETCASAFMPGVAASAALIGNAEVYTNAIQAFSAHRGVSQEPALAPYAR
jgi:triacylglycerol esterase/lipase EstA (alpha/beta hydrolase family)